MSAKSHHVSAVFICLAAVISNAFAQITEDPSDVAGRLGENVNITCGVSNIPQDDGFEWSEYVTTDGAVRIFSKPEYDPINSNKYGIYGEYNLEVKSVQLEDGGNYACKMFSDTSGRGAHMFVFGPHTLLSNRMVEGETQNLTCQINFGATRNLPDNEDNIPQMSIEVNGQMVQGIQTTFMDQTETQPYMLSGYAPYTARATDSGSDFVCIVGVRSPAGYTARDSKEMDIQYPVRQPTFSPLNGDYVVGDYINCTADGSPAPDYRWEALQSPAGEIGFDMSRLQITEDMVNDLSNSEDFNRWRCTAKNRIGLGAEEQEASSEIEFTVRAGGNTGESKPKIAGWKVGVGVGVPIAIIVIVVAVVVGIMFARKRKANKETAAKANKLPPPEVGSVNRGAAFPGDGDLVNGMKPPLVSNLPNPLPEDIPANRSRDSPGYADLGVKQISNSYPGVNVSMSSVDSFDDSRNTPPANQRPPQSHMNPSFQQTTPPQHRPQRPTYLNVGDEPVKPNHPDTFV